MKSAWPYLLHQVAAQEGSADRYMGKCVAAWIEVRCSLASAVAWHNVMLRAMVAVTLTQQRVPDVL